jgi:AraC family transcriptional activator of pobA
VGKLSQVDLSIFEDGDHSHRHDFHFFLLQEKGTACFEIDFEQYNTSERTIIYLHPDQVHRAVEISDVSLYVLTIKNQYLNNEYLKLLAEITPTYPTVLKKETFELLLQSISLCLKLSDEKHNRLYSFPLKDSCNTFVSLVIGQYLTQTKPIEKISRFDVITKEFKLALERNYVSLKRPGDYARILNISTPYLNECVRNATGYAVSYHIQQRVILEAKRLLYHSNSSVKEIAIAVGYSDYAYFSRIFSKLTGMSALTFRQKTSIGPIHTV